ncbi:MAG: ABC-ATPase UvrA, partial [Pirellulaceae bacterium]
RGGDRGQETGEDGGSVPKKRRGRESKSGAESLAEVGPFLSAHNATLETPLDQLPPDVFEKLLCGESQSQFPGLFRLLEREYATATESGRMEQLEAFRSQVTCAACGGARLRPEALAVRIGGNNIHEVSKLAVDKAGQFCQSLRWPGDDEPLAAPILHEIAGRLEFLQKVGLSYLTLERPADTLSGGEQQRVRLATGIGSGLTGILYILDEPSIGLHPRDNDRLIGALRELQQQGNTILVVEHDEAMMRQADWLIDIGPGAGIHGGEVLSQGTPEDVAADPQSITGGYLSGRLQIDVPKTRRRVAKSRALVLEGATLNNLQNVSATIPLGVFVAVTGVSGS